MEQCKTPRQLHLSYSARYSTFAEAAGATSFPAGNQAWSSVSIIDSTYNDKTDTGIYPIVTMTYGFVYQTTDELQSRCRLS